MKNCSIIIHDDSAFELEEKFQVYLSNPLGNHWSGATVGKNNVATVIISNDEDGKRNISVFENAAAWRVFRALREPPTDLIPAFHPVCQQGILLFTFSISDVCLFSLLQNSQSVSFSLAVDLQVTRSINFFPF